MKTLLEIIDHSFNKPLNQQLLKELKRLGYIDDVQVVKDHELLRKFFTYKVEKKPEKREGIWGRASFFLPQRRGFTQLGLQQFNQQTGAASAAPSDSFCDSRPPPPVAAAEEAKEETKEEDADDEYFAP